MRNKISLCFLGIINIYVYFWNYNLWSETWRKYVRITAREVYGIKYVELNFHDRSHFERVALGVHETYTARSLRLRVGMCVRFNYEIELKIRRRRTRECQRHTLNQCRCVANNKNGTDKGTLSLLRSWFPTRGFKLSYINLQRRRGRIAFAIKFHSEIALGNFIY